VPEDFTGKYKIQVDIDLGPIEKKPEDTWYAIE